ncbi:MAG: acyl carrier protein [Patescibacteria group bacterium]|jgi:acyl carrier protein
MNKNDLFVLISNVFGVEPGDINRDSDFYDDLNADSTDMIELKLQLEDELKTKLDDDEYLSVQTVGDLIDLIEEYSNDYID